MQIRPAARPPRRQPAAGGLEALGHRPVARDVVGDLDPPGGELGPDAGHPPRPGRRLEGRVLADHHDVLDTGGEQDRCGRPATALVVRDDRREPLVGGLAVEQDGAYAAQAARAAGSRARCGWHRPPRRRRARASPRSAAARGRGRRRSRRSPRGGRARAPRRSRRSACCCRTARRRSGRRSARRSRSAACAGCARCGWGGSRGRHRGLDLRHRGRGDPHLVGAAVEDVGRRRARHARHSWRRRAAWRSCVASCAPPRGVSAVSVRGAVTLRYRTGS